MRNYSRFSEQLFVQYQMDHWLPPSMKGYACLQPAMAILEDRLFQTSFVLGDLLQCTILSGFLNFPKKLFTRLPSEVFVGGLNFRIPRIREMSFFYEGPISVTIHIIFRTFPSEGSTFVAFLVRSVWIFTRMTDFLRHLGWTGWTFDGAPLVGL